MSTAAIDHRAVVGPVRRLLPCTVLGGLILAACTPPPNSPLSRPDADQNVSVTTERTRTEQTIRRVDFVLMTEVPASRQVVWPILEHAWDDVGLPEPTVDDRTYTMGVANYIVTRRLGRSALSTYLNCGSGAAGWNADSHRIRLTVRTMLERVTADSTRIHTRVDATATPTEGTSSNRIDCTSRGALELQIATRVRERLGLPTGR